MFLRVTLKTKSLKTLVGVGRFELPTPCSRSRCATRLRYTPSGWKVTYIDKRLGPRNRGLAVAFRQIAAGTSGGLLAPFGHMSVGASALRLGKRAAMVRRASSHYPRWQRAGACECKRDQLRRFYAGAWPSGKATGFGPVILGSNPSAPAKLYSHLFALFR